MTGKNEYFETFCSISKALGTALTTDEILSLIVTSAVECMGGKAACLFLADEEEDVFVPRAQVGLSDTYLHAPPMQARRVVEDILEGGYLVIEDATSDPRLENHEAKKAEGIASILVAPVMVRDRAIGVLSLYTSQPRAFSADEIGFLTAVAEQGGMAIQHARLLERLRQSSRLFYEFASMLNASLDIRKILHILSANIGEALRMAGIAISLWDGETGKLESVAVYGLSEEFWAKFPKLGDPRVKLALAGETVIHRPPELEGEPHEIKSMLYQPLKAGDEVIGLMALCSRNSERFTEDLTQLAGALAHQGGLAIRNASTYLMLEQEKKELEREIWSHKSWF